MFTFVCLFVCIVVHLEGSTPTKYGLLLNNDDRYKAVKRELSKYCGLVSSQLLLVEIFGASVRVKYILHDVNKHKTVRTKLICSSCTHKNDISCFSHTLYYCHFVTDWNGWTMYCWSSSKWCQFTVQDLSNIMVA